MKMRMRGRLRGREQILYSSVLFFLLSLSPLGSGSDLLVDLWLASAIAKGPRGHGARSAGSCGFLLGLVLSSVSFLKHSEVGLYSYILAFLLHKETGPLPSVFSSFIFKQRE